MSSARNSYHTAYIVSLLMVFMVNGRVKWSFTSVVPSVSILSKSVCVQAQLDLPFHFLLQVENHDCSNNYFPGVLRLTLIQGFGFWGSYQDHDILDVIVIFLRNRVLRVSCAKRCGISFSAY